ncbi:MAG TPA: EamA family transporter [Candidatus Limnocylindrales bacterium]|nr:EamA family transporter [Candidatus Limnocylindrales bacterium]
MADRGTRFDWLVFLALGGFWGSSYLFIKFGVETLTPFVLIALRLGIGLSLLMAVVAYAREPLPRSPRIYGHLLVMSVINIVLPFWLITTAEQSVDSSLASILNSTVPLFVILIAAGFLHDEPITVNRLVGLVVGFGGVILLTGGNIAVGGETFGTLALVGSSIAYAVGSVYARRNVRGLRPMIPALFQVAFAFVLSSVLAFVFEDPLSIQLTPQAVGSVVWLGLVGSGLAYLAFFRLLAHWGPTRTSLVAYLLPIWGIALGALFAAEVVDVRVLVGTGLVLTGVALVNSRYGGRRLFGRAAPTTGA